MRKLIFFMFTSLDGYFEGENHDISWHNADAGEFNEFAEEQLNAADILLFGRVTYELMASFWPSEIALTTDPIIANKMNSSTKIVFSTTLKKAGWQNTRLIKENVKEEILKLKQQEGKDLCLLGSSNLAVSLSEMGLIDEYRIMVNPLILGKGTPLLNGLEKPFNLELFKTRVFKSGNVLLYYKPAK